jgi:ParB/RepB/Spo0J family partition protein
MPKAPKTPKTPKAAAPAAITMMIVPSLIKMDLDKNRKAGMDAESIKALAANIKTHGLLQPVMLNKVNNELWCVYGHRRTLAVMEAGLPMISAIIRENMSEKDIAAARVIENEQHEDTSPIDKAKSMALLKFVGFSQNEIADMIPRTYPADVSRTLSLLKLPQELQDKVHNSQLTVQAALSLVPASPAEQAEVAKAIEAAVAPLVAEGASDAAVKRASTEVVTAQNAKQGTTTKPTRAPKAPAAPRGNINDVQPPAPVAAAPAPVAPAPAAPKAAAAAPAPTKTYQTREGSDPQPEEPAPAPRTETSVRLEGLANLLSLFCRLEEDNSDSVGGRISTILIDCFENVIDIDQAFAAIKDIEKA